MQSQSLGHHSVANQQNSSLCIQTHARPTKQSGRSYRGVTLQTSCRLDNFLSSVHMYTVGAHPTLINHLDLIHSDVAHQNFPRRTISLSGVHDGCDTLQSLDADVDRKNAAALSMSILYHVSLCTQHCQMRKQHTSVTHSSCGLTVKAQIILDLPFQDLLCWTSGPTANAENLLRVSVYFQFACVRRVVDGACCTFDLNLNSCCSVLLRAWCARRMSD